MKKRSRMLAMILTGCLAVSVTGCMKAPTEEGKGGNEGGSDTAPTQVTTDIPEGLWDPYNETVTIRTVLPENAGIQFREGDSYDDNPWYRAYKDRLNIQVVNDWVSNDYKTKLNLNIADGNLPDVFAATGSQLQQLYEADLIWDLTEVFDKYGSDLLKGYMKAEDATYQTALRDGKLYGIPQLTYGIIDQPNQIWIRKDWKEKLNLEDPKTMDDLVEIGKAFQTEFGGYAFTETQQLLCMNILASAWGAHPEIWIEAPSGQLEYGSIQPEMKEVLKTYSQWYKDGLINPEFTITDQAKMFQGVISGEIGINPMAQWWGYQPGPDVVKNLGPDSIFEAYKIPSANGEPLKEEIKFSNYGYLVVSKKCQNPEAVVKLINFYAYMMDEAQEKETPEFIESLFGNAYTNIPYALRVINPMTDYNQFVKVSEALEKGTDVDVTSLGKDATKYNNCVAFINEGAATGVGDWLQQGSPKSAYRIAKEMIDNEEYVKDAIWGQPTETLLNTGTTLDDILLEGFTKIIVGEQPLESFDALVESWKKAGGEQATKEVNEVYGKK